jgi:hypothetical protein
MRSYSDLWLAGSLYLARIIGQNGCCSGSLRRSIIRDRTRRIEYHGQFGQKSRAEHSTSPSIPLPCSNLITCFLLFPSTKATVYQHLLRCLTHSNREVMVALAPLFPNTFSGLSQMSLMSMKRLGKLQARPYKLRPMYRLEEW